LAAGWIGFEKIKENQFIDFRLITQSRKNHVFILLCQQPQADNQIGFYLSKFINA
jgi:hypothetical protein